MSSELETQVKDLIIEALMLEDVSADDIDVEKPLFGEGLGLDSIDALELAIAIDQKFGVRIKAEDEGTRAVFRSVRSLAAHIASHQGQAVTA